MKRVYHRTSKYVTPMLIVDGDVGSLTKHIWETSSSLKDEDKANPDFVVIETDVCYLDPGGFISVKNPFKEITIENNLFKVKLSHIEQMLYLMSLAEERVPGFMRFPIWSGWCNCLVIMPKSMFSQLTVSLRNMMMSSEALHASLDFNDCLESIKKYNSKNNLKND